MTDEKPKNIGLRNHANVSYNGMCEDDEEEKGEVNIGEEYQAVVPPLATISRRNVKEPPREIQLWAPTSLVTNGQLAEYLSEVRQMSDMSEEQALGLLFWCGYNVAEASNSLKLFQPKTTEWSDQDKALFEMAYYRFGKEFTIIKKHVLKDKSRAALVNYYYTWKNSQLKTSFVDHQIKLQEQLGEQKEQGNRKRCEECGIECEDLNKSCSPSLELCPMCHGCYEKTGVILFSKKPICFGKEKATFINNEMEELSMPMVKDDEGELKSIDDLITERRRKVQRYKQKITSTRETMAERMKLYKSKKKARFFTKWSEREQKLVAHALDEYNMSAKELAEVLTTKSEAQVIAYLEKYHQQESDE